MVCFILHSDGCYCLLLYRLIIIMIRNSVADSGEVRLVRTNPLRTNWIANSLALLALLKGCLRKYYAQTHYIHYTHTGTTQKPHYQYESAYFPVPYTDNQLLCSLCSPKQSYAFNSVGFKHIIQLLQFHPKITPETISDGQKSKIVLGAGGFVHFIITYSNPPSQNSTSATGITH